MTTLDTTGLDLVKALYAKIEQSVATGRARMCRPLTFAEKILFNHLIQPESQETQRGQSYANLQPDRVAMQDATAQMALLQFMTAGLHKVAVPATVHCDHLIQAEVGADADLEHAELNNKEVYDFLRSVSAKYGIGFWKPGSGIIHQVVLEQYAFPGGMMIGTDSHTPNAGGMGMIAVGVGGADAVDVMVGLPFGLRWPKLIGVKLTGTLSGWASPKDIILRVAQILTVKGGTGAIVEYFGDGTKTLSATGKATICNMGAEIGATTSLFPYDDKTHQYLLSTGRAELGELANNYACHLQADPEVSLTPDVFFDEVIEIDLDALEPQIVGPHTPDLGRDISAIGDEASENNWPTELKSCLIGSCTNSSYEDISRAANVARQAREKNLKIKTTLYVTPGSERTRATVERDGFLDDLTSIGATVLANACGPCIGQWKRNDVEQGEPNSILSSYNRNFPKRNDGNAATLSFIASPEIVTAFALTGNLAINPITDPVDGTNLDVPHGVMLPERGFAPNEDGFVEPPSNGDEVSVVVAPDSDRLQLLTPFPAWDGDDFTSLTVLLKARGKCTTDHISAAGPWLRYRGHLDHICGNLFLGAINSFSDRAGYGIDQTTNEERPLPDIARSYKEAGIGWVAIGDENYGEGSSREHAAMEPRYMNAKAIIVRSFARIHETNLKKQGVLPLTFADPNDYDKIVSSDRMSIVGLSELEPGKAVVCRIEHDDATTEDFYANHTLSHEHIEWFKAGGALNVIRASGKR